MSVHGPPGEFSGFTERCRTGVCRLWPSPLSWRAWTLMRHSHMRRRCRVTRCRVALAEFRHDCRRDATDGFPSIHQTCELPTDKARTLDVSGVATPCRGRSELVSTTAVLTRAQPSYSDGFRGAYAPHPLRAMPPCPPSTAMSSVWRTNPHDAPAPLAVLGRQRAQLRVVPVRPAPPMAALPSDPGELGHAWRLMRRGVERL